MTEVIGVRFKQVGKIYYFSPNGVQMPIGEKVIVETASSAVRLQLQIVKLTTRAL